MTLRNSEVSYFRTENGGSDWLPFHHVSKATAGEMFLSPRSKRIYGLIKIPGEVAFLEIFDLETQFRNRLDTCVRGEVRAFFVNNELECWILEAWNENSWREGAPKSGNALSVLHHSGDGGESWSIVSQMEEYIAKLLPIGQKKMLAVGPKGVSMSNNSGKSWSRMLERTRVPLFDIDFVGPIGVALGSEDLIETNSDLLMLTSVNSGETWEEAELPAVEAVASARIMTWNHGILASSTHLYSFDLVR